MRERYGVAADRDSTPFPRSEELKARAHRLIPGGAHTYAKGDDQYPVLAPGFIAHGRGCRVWDVDGHEYIEFGSGLRAVTLGHAEPRVIEAASQGMLLGNNFVRPAAIEVQAAEAMLAAVGADMVKFTKNGSDATTAAVKLARAATGRDLVAICRDHPFYSIDDWFIGTTAMPAGIPHAVRELTVTFAYDDPDDLLALFDAHPGRIACVMLEPVRDREPSPGYLQRVRDIAHERGAVFVLDEMIAGFRYRIAGGGAMYGVVPDLATYGKGMANGFSVSALVGRRELMELGGLRDDRERVFLLSTTHGAETPALAAAIATIGIFRDEPVIDALWRAGRRLRDGFAERAAARELTAHVGPVGLPPNLAYFTRDGEGRPSQPFRTLFLQELIRGGVLAPSLVVNYAHRDDDLDRALDVIDGALAVYARALDGGVERFLVGRPVQPVMRPFRGLL